MSSYTPIFKKSKCEANDGRDIISKLPQDVTAHILSRLPSKDALRTSILSKDWVYKWTSSYSIDIDDTGATAKKRAIFYNFVNKMLRPSHDLKSFRFLCHYKHSSTRVKAWMSAASRRNIESIEIQFPNSLELTKGFINNKALGNLKLMPAPTFRFSSLNHPFCTFRVTNCNCFPTLTCLYLTGVEIQNESTDTDRVVFSLPALQTLELLNCKWSNANLMDFHCPALTTFKCETNLNAVDTGYTINIIGARLAKFESCGRFQNIILTNSDVRTAALMNVWPCDLQTGLQVRKLMDGFPGVMELKLSGDVCLSIALSIQNFPLPRYDQLQRLVIGDAKLLLDLLYSAPSLKFLEVEFHVLDNSRRILSQSSVERDFAVVDPLPYCIPHQLEEVKIKCYHGRTYEKPVGLAKLLLRYGAVLKKVHLYTYCCEFSANTMVEQLLRYPRASANVEISASSEHIFSFLSYQPTY